MDETNSLSPPIRQYRAGDLSIQIIDDREEFNRLLARTRYRHMRWNCPFTGRHIGDGEGEGRAIVIQHPFFTDRVICIAAECASLPVEELLVLMLAQLKPRWRPYYVPGKEETERKGTDF